ncbi:MAG: hypothetical protein HXK95_002800 [Candidatus Nanogingivalaceae bacterium]|nr:MAG: hypothetical protein HXK95_002800 [Candidatus Nanogingivalaceae bacterium]
MSTNNIKKFAKYGLVLVAAITIATAAQAQQGTMQKVYADETTTQFTADNSRMFYLKYTLSDQPEITWMQGAVVGPNGYTVQAPDDVDGYPYYTITGPQGNQYSVGDKITTEEPGLFGHTNPEDDALNYLYYKTDPNASTSEAPAPSTSPSTSEAPAPSTSPSTSEAANKDHAVEKPSQKADDKTTATDKAKNATDKKTDSKKAKDQVKTEKSKGATVAAKDDSTSKKAEASAPAEQAKAVKANTNANSQDNIVKEADGTVDTAAVHNDNNGGAILTMLGLVSAAFIGLFKNKKEEK